MHLNISSTKWRPFCPGGDGLRTCPAIEKKCTFQSGGENIIYECIWMNWPLLIPILSLFCKGHDYCKWVWSCKLWYESTSPAITCWYLKHHYENLISPLVIHEQIWYVPQDLHPRKTFLQHQYLEVMSPDVNTLHRVTVLQTNKRLFYSIESNICTLICPVA